MQAQNPHGESADTSIAFATEDGCVLRITLVGSVGFEELPSLWVTVTNRLKEQQPERIVIDLERVPVLAGAGLGLMAQIRREAAALGSETSFVGLDENGEALLESSLLEDPRATAIEAQRARSPIGVVGQSVGLVLDDARVQIIFMGELISAFLWAIRNPKRIRYTDLLSAAENTGVDALPIVCMQGFLVGFIVAFLATRMLEPFGAVTMIPAVAAVGIVREFAPLMSAIFLAGRAGSYFAAEIGTMKVTEELNALRTMGLDLNRFLALPRILATMLTMPFLTVFFVLTGLTGSYLVCLTFDVGLQSFLGMTRVHINYIDLLGALFKSLVFAFILSSTGCLRGFETGRGPGAVGASATRALVDSVAFIVLADGLLSALYYVIGI